MTLGEQLKDVQEAIQKLVKANIASYKVGEQEITRNRLRDLRAMENDLIAKIQQLGANYDPLVAEHIKGGKVRISFNG